jgi:hypothetical protein
VKLNGSCPTRESNTKKVNNTKNKTKTTTSKQKHNKPDLCVEDAAYRTTTGMAEDNRSRGKSPEPDDSGDDLSKWVLSDESGIVAMNAGIASRFGEKFPCDDGSE